MKIANKSFVMDLDVERSRLCFEGDVLIDKTAGKTAEDMKHLLYSRNVDESEILYEFYVGTAEQKHKERIAEKGLRYDLILVSPGKVGGEYKKTSGHVHEGLYPEIYEVLYGTALFILQKGNGREVKEFSAVKTMAGEKILIPPGYTHATVNIGESPLLFSDLVAHKCKNHYGDVKINHGMCYYVICENGLASLKRNPFYEKVPEARIIIPVEKKELGLDFDIPVYDIVSREPARYDYLAHPEGYTDEIDYLAKIIEGGLN